jgi:hypothetical protein
MPAARELRDLIVVRDLAGTHRTRNGRLAVNWFSRRSKARWRLVPLDGQWYDRARLRGAVAKNRRVPHSMRPLTAEELADVLNAAPWSLAPPRRRRR